MEKATRAMSSSIEEAFETFCDEIGRRPSKLWETYYYDKAAAARAVEFIETYLHVGEDNNEDLFILQWWQKRLILKLFGWKRWSDHTRRYRVFFLFIAKKNGKTTLIAAIAIYLAFAEGEPAPMIACVAADKEQARVMFRMITNMVTNNPKLAARANCLANSIFLPQKLGSIQVMSKKPEGKHGPSWQAVLVDEGHAIENRDTVRALTKGTIARAQPLVCYTSTAGHDRTHWFYHLYQAAKDVHQGIIEQDDWLVEIFEADHEKWTDPKEWKKANPNLGITFKEEDFEREFETARKMPIEENDFKKLNLNIWVDSAIQCIDMEKWDLCVKQTNGEFSDDHKTDAPIETLLKQPCYAGLDLAATMDLTSLVLVFPPFGTRTFYDVLAWFWFPEGNLERRRRRLGATDVTPWAKSGHISLTDGEVIDYDNIRGFLNDDLDKKYNIKEIAIDPWNAVQLSTQLDGDGWTVVPTRTTGYAAMSDPTKHLIGLIHEEQINHRRHPVLRWNARNLVVVEDAAGNIKPHKQKSKEKIDGMVALILGLSRCLANAGVKTSKYSQSEVVVVG